MTRTARLALAGALAGPWLFIWQGLDFTDQGYLVTGYRCFLRYPEVTDDSGHMWLTNLVGAVWDAIFGGLGLVGMRALWALCMSLGMLLAFRLCRSVTNESAAAFSVLVASAFLSDRRETWFSYNTLSSVVFVSAAVCMSLGVARRRPSVLFAAGVLMGISPFARFPNLLVWALPSALGLAAFVEPERRPRLLRDIGINVLGILSGVGGMLLCIWLRGDAALYFRGVASLFAPSMQDAGYATDSLFVNFLRDEGLALAWGFGVCVFATGLSWVLKVVPNSIGWALLAVCCALGIFGLTSTEEPWRWVVPGTTYFVLAGIALGVWRLSLEQRISAWLALIVVVIAPLGSNNGIKNAHVGLWLALPLVLASLQALSKEWLAGQGPKLALLLALVLSGEAVHRAANYTYRDGIRSSLRVTVPHPQLRGQFTTAARAKVVTEVLSALEERVAPGDYLLAYEGTPLLQYLTKTRPYLNRPWLMGWERGEVVQQLVADAPRRTGCLPVVVVTSKSTRGADWPRRARKLEGHPSQVGTRRVLKAFLRANGYKRTWDNGFFEILEPVSVGQARCR